MFYRLIVIALFTNLSCSTIAQQPANGENLKGFVKNENQVLDQKGEPNNDVAFLFTNGRGMNVQLQQKGFSYDTYRPIRENKRQQRYLYHRLDFEFIDANEQIELRAAGRFDRVLNYIRGGVHTSTRSYERVRYTDVYENIDVLFKQGKEGKFKYDFILKPGAQLDDIRIKIKGYEQLQLNDGVLSFSLSTGTLEERIPISWYRSTGEEVDVNYTTVSEKNDECVIGFQMNNALKPEQKLIIDPEPQLDWGMYFGDSLNSAGSDVSTDVDGLIYATGTTSSFQHIATAGAYKDTITGNTDAYLTKAYTTGYVLWSTYFGGSGDDSGYSLAIDTAKNIYLAGETNSTDLTVTDSLFQDSLQGSQDLYIAKFTEDGDYVYSSYYGSSGVEKQPHVDCDFGGNLYLAATTDSATLSTTGAYQMNFGGVSDLFITKFSSNFQKKWCTYLGGADRETGTSIKISDALLYLTGETRSSGMSSSGVHQEVKSDSLDGFVAQLDTAGQFQWFTYFGGQNLDVVTSLEVLDNTIAFSGYTSSDSLIAFGGNPFQSQRNGGSDAFFGRINEDGSLVWSSFYGGAGNDFGVDLSLEYDNNIVLAGNTESVDSISTTDVHQESNNGGFDVFIAKFDTTGGRIWGSYYGGPDNDICHSVDVYGNTNIYTTGFTYSDTNMVDSSASGHLAEYAFNKDAFLTKFNQDKSTQCNGGSCSGGSGGGSGTQGDPFKICAGEEITLTTNGGATGSNSQWVWYEGGCGSAGNQVGTGDSIVVTPVSTTVYYVRAESGTDATNCVSIYIDVMETPTVEVLSDEVFCLNSGYQLQGSADYDYHWEYPNGSVITDLNPTIAPTSIQDTGWYVLSATANSSGCTVNDSIYLSPADSIQYEFDVDSISCYGYNDGAIEILPEDSTYLYSWNSLSDTTNDVDSLSPGEYAFNITDTNSCTLSDTVTLDAKDPFIIDTITHPTGCEYDDGFVELILDSTQGAFDISWSHESSLQNSFADSLGHGSYTAIVTSGEGCIDTVVATVENENGLAIDIVNSLMESCPGQNDGAIAVETEGGDGETQLIWSHDSTFVDTAAENLPPGIYEVTVVDQQGCSAMDSVEIFKAPELTWSASIDSADCGKSGGSILLDISSTNFLSSVVWSPDQDQSLHITDLSAGQYIAEVKDTNNCVYFDTIHVAAKNNLEVTVDPAYEGISAGDTVLLTAITPNGLSNYTFNWSPESYITCADCAMTQVNPVSTTNYVVTAHHENGCYGRDTAKVAIENECVDLFIPDHFSPNNDGVNDEWCVIGSCIQSIQVRVYNRWGQNLFTSESASSCWDGQFKQEPIPNGPYVYEVKAELITGEKIQRKGSLNVVR